MLKCQVSLPRDVRRAPPRQQVRSGNLGTRGEHRRREEPGQQVARTPPPTHPPTANGDASGFVSPDTNEARCHATPKPCDQNART